MIHNPTRKRGFLSRILANRNQFTAGTAIDRATVDFRQSSQLGYLNANTVGIAH